MTVSRDRQLARRASKTGIARYSLRIVWEARRAKLPISLGFALVEQESGFRNIYGHDPTISVGAGAVTEANYRNYKRRRGPTGRGGMQGVGPCQLTWYSYQDAADKLGGCWVARHNIRVGFGVLADSIRQYGKSEGIARYNGSGSAADRYSREVRAKEARWHKRLTAGTR